MIEKWITDELKRSLQHVLWIGGATDSGKTTTAKLLAETYNLSLYSGDFAGQKHWAHIDPVKQPAMYKWFSMSVDERWVTCSVEYLTEITMQIMNDRLPLIVDDLLSLRSDKLIVAEWYGFLPNNIMPLISNPHQSIWLLSNAKFKQASVLKRGKKNFHQDTSNPQKAWDNHLNRDLNLGNIVKQQAQNHDMRIIINNGNYDTNEVLAMIESHFAPILSS